MYERKLEMLEEHGYNIIHIDGLDYVETDEDIPLLVCVDDILDVIDFLNL